MELSYPTPLSPQGGSRRASSSRGMPYIPFCQVKGSIFKVKVGSKLINYLMYTHVNALPGLGSVPKFTLLLCGAFFYPG
jgi:hypothetical protein